MVPKMLEKMTPSVGKRLIGSHIEQQNYSFMSVDGALLACRIWPIMFLLFLTTTTNRKQILFSQLIVAFNKFNSYLTLYTLCTRSRCLVTRN